MCVYSVHIPIGMFIKYKIFINVCVCVCAFGAYTHRRTKRKQSTENFSPNMYKIYIVGGGGPMGEWV